MSGPTPAATPIGGFFSCLHSGPAKCYKIHQGAPGHSAAHLLPWGERLNKFLLRIYCTHFCFRAGPCPRETYFMQKHLP